MSRFYPSRTPRLLNAVLLAILIALILVVTTIYVSHERIFYFWDYKGFQDRALDLTQYLRGLADPSISDFVTVFGLIRSSTFNDYSHYPAVLPALAALGFGSSRLVYILALMLFHMLPFTLVVGGIAAQLSTLPRHVVFWSAAFVTALIPTIWAPTLRGYPDISAALFMALAILVYLRDLTNKRWWHIVLIGLMLALAMLFRRHFVYGAASFFIAAGLEKLIRFFYELRRKPLRLALLPLLAGSVRLSFVLVAVMVATALFGPYFIGRLLNDNFGSLYSSYIFSLGETAAIFLNGYGWIICTAATAGFILAARRGLLRNPGAGFLALFSGVMLLVWIMLVRQMGEHYPLHIAVSVVVGLVALGSVLWDNRGRALLLVGCAFLLGNFLFSLNPFLVFPTTALNPLFAATISAVRPPLVDPNYDEQLRLVNVLRGLNPTAVFVAASSGKINQNLLMSADEVARGDGTSLNILYTPDIDSRDYYPLEQLLQADVVLVAEPFQFTFSAQEQDVVGVVVTAFADDWPISRDFEPLPETFDFTEDTVVRIYRRIRPPSLDVALRTFQAMLDFIGQRPGGQADWIRLSRASAYQLSEVAPAQYLLSLTIPTDGTAVSLIYLNPFSGQLQIDGMLSTNESCEGYSLRFEAVSDLDDAQTRRDVVEIPVETGDTTVELSVSTSAYLLLTVIGEGSDGECELTFQNLNIHRDNS